MRRGAPEVIVGILLAVLLASYVVYTRRVVRDLRIEAERSSRMYARVLRAQTDTSADAVVVAQAFHWFAGELALPQVVADDDFLVRVPDVFGCIGEQPA